MKRREFISLAVAASLFAGGAWAKDLQEQLSAQLRAQGFRELEFSRTWLGRGRIVARSRTREREIIFNDRTGEILRDVWRRIGEDGHSGSGRLFDPHEADNSGSSDDSSDDDNSGRSHDSSDDDSSDDDRSGKDGGDSSDDESDD